MLNALAITYAIVIIGLLGWAIADVRERREIEDN